MIRPWISRSPRVRSSCSSTGASGSPGSSMPAAPVTARSRGGVGRGPAGAVGPGAQVTGGVQRAAAEGTRLTSGGDDRLGPPAEGAGQPCGKPYDEHLLRLRLLDLLLRGAGL